MNQNHEKLTGEKKESYDQNKNNPQYNTAKQKFKKNTNAH